MLNPSPRISEAIAHGTPSWTLAIFSTIVALTGVGLAAHYFFIKVNAQSPAATELANGLTAKINWQKLGIPFLNKNTIWTTFTLTS